VTLKTGLSSVKVNVICEYVHVCVCVCINCVYSFIVFFFECVGVLPFDGEIKMYILKMSTLDKAHMTSY